MNSYLIAYDVDTTTAVPKSPAQVYADIKEKIESYPVHGQLTESCWLIRSAATHVAIRDAFKGIMRSSDRLLVLKFTNVAAWRNLKSDTKWVEDNI